MNRAGKIAICLAGGLALNAGLRADDIYPDNPYATIVARNVFDLEPIPTNDPDAQQPGPVVTITPNGIMKLFGNLQVLFKTKTTPAPGTRARPGVGAGQGDNEQSYILAQGQRQDDIEVLKIDEKAGVITFSNHGIKQELPLANGTAMSSFMNGYQGSAIPAANGNAGNSYGVVPRNGSFGGGGSFGARRGLANGVNGAMGNGINSGLGSGYSGSMGNGISGGNNSGVTSGLNLGNLQTGNGTYQPQPSTTTPEGPAIAPEAVAAQILINTEAMKEAGNPAWRIMPPPPMPPAP
jgi:hypothetical protein